MTVGLVLSVYKENIEYLSSITKHFTNIYIYLKDKTRYEEIKKQYNSTNIKIHILENIGRESQTYLYHIHTYYEILEDYIYFLQGHPFDHIKYNVLLEYIRNEKKESFFPLGNKIYMCDGNGFPHHRGLPIKEFYTIIKPTNNISLFYFYPGAQFIVSKKNIQKNSQEFYLLLDKTHTTVEKLPWILERLWKYILDE